MLVDYQLSIYIWKCRSHRNTSPPSLLENQKKNWSYNVHFSSKTPFSISGQGMFYKSSTRMRFEWKKHSWIKGNLKMKSLNSMQISSFWSVKVSERIREWVEILLISILRYQNNYVVSLFIFKWFGNLCRTRSVRKLPILILLLLLEASLENEKESYLLILIEASGFPKNEWLL